MIKFIDNIGDFFSSNYFDEDFVKKVHSKSGYSFDDQKELQKRITPLKDKYYRYKQNIIEGRLRIKDKIYETHQFHSLLLNALGYDGDHHQYDEPFHFKEKEVLPVRHKLYRGDKLHLLIMEMQPLIKEGDEEPDGLFEQRYNIEEEELESKEQRYHRVQWSRVFKISEELKISPVIINKAISELSLLDQKERPQYILLLAGNKVFLIEVEKWFRGSYLQLDLEELFTEATIERKYYSLFYLMLSKEMLAPDSEMVLMDQLEEDSHKSAYEVTKDLKEGIIHAVEALANEALHYKKGILKEEFDESDDTFEAEIKDDCLSIVYRLLFVFYAESRADLDILPISDSVYQKGYSLEMLRDLEQTKLVTDHSLNGYFFHESLKQLFQLMSSGYRENENGANKSFRIRHIDSPMFDDTKLHHLSNVKFRNYVWQDVICQLSLSRQQNKKARGRISYANLGINQLGSVYESLLAYRGFYAEEDYIEVHPKKKPKEGTLLVQRKRRDDFHEDEVLKDESGKEVVIPKGQFVYRLSGRDRQKSASYYTPEVLTQCTVKYTLKGILEKVENGEMKALDLLDLKLLEPAMGAAAFHNELINQLAEAYLSYRQKEKKEKISPEKYREELQKVKAYIATNNAYGVDLNPTAIELGKLSLWLNVIHKDMETPFFANRLATGNAVVGAWFKVYTEAQLKKKWWENAPKLLQLGPDGKKRGKNEIYHFLLPDKGMVPSAGIKLLKAEFPEHAKRVTDWRKEVIKPITGEEFLRLQKICDSIDEQLEEYYTFQKRLNAQTKNKVDIWGGYKNQEQIGLNLRSYDEKEQLNDQRNRQSAPYYKLKMVMDYWCSLWFWDVRKAEHLPTRQQYINDVASILNIDLTKQPKAEKVANNYILEVTPSLFEEPSVGEQAQQQIIEKTQKGDLFDNKERLEEVKILSGQHRFFHNQLEFIEVFKERGGFDLINGNPPWLKITFEAKSIISERRPEVEIHDYDANGVDEILEELLESDGDLKELYIREYNEMESTSTFLNGFQNYPLLKGQQTNLYKCILSNTFNITSENGFIGLLHPETIFDDPKGQDFRREIYPRLKYYFRFQNALNLFPEVGHRKKYCSVIYSGSKSDIAFKALNNLFHPSTIDSSFTHNGLGLAEGIKVKDEKTGKFDWNLKGHKDRIVNISIKQLKLFSELFEGGVESESCKLVSFHADSMVAILEVLNSFPIKVAAHEYKTSECLHETNAIKKLKIIKKETKFPIIDDYELIYSGPHFYVAQPIYKTPREKCTEKGHYDIIDLSSIDEEFLPRTNYVPSVEIDKFLSNLDEFDGRNWNDYFKLGWSKMLNLEGERTLQGAILAPKVAHINGLISIIFKSQSELIEFAGLNSSLVFDFFIKTIGASNLTDSRIKALPIDIENHYKPYLFSRTLRLNCLTSLYRELWECNFNKQFSNDSWSKRDGRLADFNELEDKWNNTTPLRNYFERRQALVEIDVIVAISIGLRLEDLIKMYKFQFPVLQQNEDDTWYDNTGNIVFTCSKGLTGVGVDRPVWNTIKDLKAGETYEHTIKKSELYHGKKVTYYAP
ncbi:MAG: Eco57I restriction-modification methylase domain-containing protein, partial [Flavobacteriaceae bacterium]